MHPDPTRLAAATALPAPARLAVVALVAACSGGPAPQPAGTEPCRVPVVPAVAPRADDTWSLELCPSMPLLQPFPMADLHLEPLVDEAGPIGATACLAPVQQAHARLPKDGTADAGTPAVCAALRDAATAAAPCLATPLEAVLADLYLLDASVRALCPFDHVYAAALARAVALDDSPVSRRIVGAETAAVGTAIGHAADAARDVLAQQTTVSARCEHCAGWLPWYALWTAWSLKDGALFADAVSRLESAGCGCDAAGSAADPCASPTCPWFCPHRDELRERAALLGGREPTTWTERAAASLRACATTQRDADAAASFSWGGTSWAALGGTGAFDACTGKALAALGPPQSPITKVTVEAWGCGAGVP